MTEKELTQMILQELIQSGLRLGDRINSMDSWLRNILNANNAPYNSSNYYNHLVQANTLLSQLKEIQSTNQEQLHRLKQE